MAVKYSRQSNLGIWAAFVLLAVSTALPSVALAGGWKVVFEDQFDGKSLDRTKWATRYLYGAETTDHLNDEIERYRDNNNHVLDASALHLVARPVGSAAYESGMIRSQQTFYYGYFEARVRLPKGRGVWPAFWLNPDYDIDAKPAWPPEIDIFEYVVNGREDTANMVHSAASRDPSGAPLNFLYHDPLFDTRIQSYRAPTPLNEAWHVFGLVWTPQAISVFLDGKRLYTREYRWVTKAGTLGPPAHILLNFAVGGAWAGRHGIDSALFPQSLDIDYVRVCQYTDTPTADQTCGGSKMTPSPKDYAYRTPYNDLPKPILKSGVTAPLKGRKTKSQSVRTGDLLDAQVTMSNLDTLPSPRDQIFGLRPVNGGRLRLFGQTPLPDSARASNADQTFSAQLSIPKDLKPGTYDVVYALLPLKQSLVSYGTQPATPLICFQQSTLQKNVNCRIGQISVTAK